jgi:hypothetical protein
VNAEVYWAPMTRPAEIEQVTTDGRFAPPDQFEYAGDAWDVSFGSQVITTYVSLIIPDSGAGLSIPDPDEFRLMLKSYPEQGIHQVDYYPQARVDGVSSWARRRNYMIRGEKCPELGTPHRRFLFGPGMKSRIS